MKIDQFVILKACCFKLDDDPADNKICIATLQYHIEKDADGKPIRSKSRYRWLARVTTIDDVKNATAELETDSKCLEPWKWPNDPSWDGNIATDDSTGSRGSAWLECRLKKMMSWDDGQRVLSGGKKDPNSPINKNAAYDIEDYQVQDEDRKVNLSDRETLKTLLGKNLSKELYRNVKAKADEEKIKNLRNKHGPDKVLLRKDGTPYVAPTLKAAVLAKQPTENELAEKSTISEA